MKSGLGRILAASLAVFALGACESDNKGTTAATTIAPKAIPSTTTATIPATTTTPAATTTTTIAPPTAIPATTTIPPPPTMPSGDAVFPGYPKLVTLSSIDSRVQNWFNRKTVDGQVVALAPGVYTPFNPNVPDLDKYLSGPNDGDCVMRDTYFPHSGGACWNGVQAGSDE